MISPYLFIRSVILEILLFLVMKYTGFTAKKKKVELGTDQFANIRFILFFSNSGAHGPVYSREEYNSLLGHSFFNAAQKFVLTEAYHYQMDQVEFITSSC
jgi:hypothetical protein